MKLKLGGLKIEEQKLYMINKSNNFKIIECPRDAMQGISNFIPTENKAKYINSLLKVGFDIIDFGSFVSPKAVPQMRDTDKLINLLQLNNNTSLLSVVLNKRGALEASSFDQISFIGYPFSVSNIFQEKNSNKTIDQSLYLVEELLDICFKKNKNLLVYISMAFGNPYNEKYSPEIVFYYLNKLSKMGVKYFTLADTVGFANLDLIKLIFDELSKIEINLGAHFHSSPESSYSKIEMAYKFGCNRFDSTISGIGGCPFAKDDLVGNISTQTLLNFIQKNKIKHTLNLLNLESACNEAKNLFKF